MVGSIIFAGLLDQAPSEMKEGTAGFGQHPPLRKQQQDANNTNYPLVLAGGRDMGYRHGQYLKFENDVPLSNLFVTIQKRMGTKADSFADSTGEMKEVLA